MAAYLVRVPSWHWHKALMWRNNHRRVTGRSLQARLKIRCPCHRPWRKALWIRLGSWWSWNSRSGVNRWNICCRLWMVEFASHIVFARACAHVVSTLFLTLGTKKSPQMLNWVESLITYREQAIQDVWNPYRSYIAQLFNHHMCISTFSEAESTRSLSLCNLVPNSDAPMGQV